MIIIPTWLAVILTLCIVYLAQSAFSRKRKLAKQIKSALTKGLTPISLPMATHHENAKFRIRYRDLDPSQELYKIGLRSGQFGVVVKHRTGMFAKTTVDGRCRFVRIQSCNYIPTNTA